MKSRYLVTESCFHVSYLVDRLHLLNSNLKVMVRDKNGLDINKLSDVHQELCHQTELTNHQMVKLEEAYQATLSLSERALIKLYGVPEHHVLSLPETTCVTNLNATPLLNALEFESYQHDLAAGIFLDCLLKPRWLEIFGGRIVNAHSAILPHARGMHAIEQIAALGDQARLATCAGASLHYIDERVDMGSLIKTQSLDQLWESADIWEVKAKSYITAFKLLADYLNHPNSFSKRDGFPYQQAIGPEFKLKAFTPEVAATAVKAFNQMKLKQMEEYSPPSGSYFKV